MNKISLTFVTTSLIFLLGLAAGNLISFPQATETVGAGSSIPVPDELHATPHDITSDSEDQISRFHDVNDDQADQQSSVDSFVHFANMQQTDDNRFDSDIESGIELVSTNESVDIPTADATRNVITAQFPDLDEETLAGWVDTYAGMPLDELTGLLQQKQLMPRIIPESSIFNSLPAELSEGSSIAIELDESIRRCESNLQHAFTIGYRRQMSLAFVTGAESDSLSYARQYDFDSGQIHVSSSKLHVAIDGASDVMFHLQPGNVLTRCGMFARQEDGSLGVRLDGAVLRVAGTSKLPLDATQVSVSPDGTVSYQDLELEHQTAGQIKLVTVSNLAALKSTNGVYFTSPELDDEAYTVNEVTALIPQSLEASNVSRDEEWKQLEHFEQLKTVRE